MELSLDRPSCCTDSKVVFYWITSTNKEWKQFVQKHGNEIRKLLPVQCWKHCQGQDNPANIPSRGMSSADLMMGPSWLNGPNWLYESQGDELESQDPSVPYECSSEMKGTQQTHNLLSGESNSCNGIFNCEICSSLRKLLRVMGYVFKFIQTLRSRIKNPDGLINCELTADDLTKSLTYWVKISQQSLWYYSVYIHVVQSGQFIQKQYPI